MCGIVNTVEPVHIFNDDDFDRIINGILIGSITVASLDPATYFKIAEKLTQGVFSGFGKTLEGLSFGNEDYQMLFDLRENVYVFSGAKTYQQTREISSLLMTKEGGVNSLSEFKKQAKDVLTQYNVNYLTTEYHSAIAQARSASQWMDFEKSAGLYPTLEYHTVGDSRVRYSHAVLDGVNKPVNDVFWNKNFPPNDWNCRCTVLQTSDNENTNMQGYKVDQHVNPLFQFNAGKERLVFSKQHPYFEVAPKDKNNARNNWGLPLPI